MAYFRGTISKYDFSQILPDSTNNETLFSTHVTNNITGNGSSVFQEGEDGFFNYIIVFVGILITTLTIVGNILVITIVISEKRLRKVGNIFIINLAVSDCLVGAIVSPLAITYDIAGKWYLGEMLCDMWVSMDVICCTASILNLCAIAYDRFKAIVEPIKYSRKRTFTRAAIVIMFVWLYSVLIALPRHLGWRKEEELHIPGGKCIISRELGYTIFSTFGAFFVPMLFMLFFYYQIYCVMCTRRSHWHIKPGHRAFIDAGSSRQRYTCSCSIVTQCLVFCFKDGVGEEKPNTLEQGTQTAKTEEVTDKNLETMHDVEETENRRESIEPELMAIYQMRNRSKRIYSAVTLGSNSTYYSSTDSSNTTTTSFSDSSDRSLYRYGDGFGRDRLSSTSTEGSHSFVGSEFGIRRQSTLRSHRLSCARQSSLHTEVIHEVASAFKLDQSEESEPEVDLELPPVSQFKPKKPPVIPGNQETEDKRENEDTSDEEEPMKRKGVRKLRASTFRRRNSRKTKRIAISQEKRAAKTLGIVMGCFIICWFPFFMMTFMRAVCEQCHFPSLVVQVVSWLGYLNSACNPFIYTFFNSDFKKAFKKLPQCFNAKRQMTFV